MRMPNGPRHIMRPPFPLHQLNVYFWSTVARICMPPKIQNDSIVYSNRDEINKNMNRRVSVTSEKRKPIFAIPAMMGKKKPTKKAQRNVVNVFRHVLSFFWTRKIYVRAWSNQTRQINQMSVRRMTHLSSSHLMRLPCPFPSPPENWVFIVSFAFKASLPFFITLFMLNKLYIRYLCAKLIIFDE